MVLAVAVSGTSAAVELSTSGGWGVAPAEATVAGSPAAAAVADGWEAFSKGVSAAVACSTGGVAAAGGGCEGTTGGASTAVVLDPDGSWEALSAGADTAT